MVLEKKFLKYFQYNFTVFAITCISLWRGKCSFIWTNLSTLYQWMVSTEVLEKNILKCLQNNFTVSLLYSLAEGHDSLFEQIWIPSTQGCLVPSFVHIGPVVLEKKSKIGKVYRQTDIRTDRWRTIGHQKSSLELSAHACRWAKNECCLELPSHASFFTQSAHCVYFFIK